MRAMPRTIRTATLRAQRGVMLIEALIAILIFSVGILGLVGLQATAVRQSSDARYRADAAQLAEQLVGRMWATDRQVATLKAQFQSCSTCTAYQDWLTTVSATLPGVSGTSAIKPTVLVNDQGIVTISLFWRAPGDDPAADAHKYNMEAQIAQ